MPLPLDLSAITCPAQLFLALYEAAAEWLPDFRHRADARNLELTGKTRDALAQQAAADVLNTLRALLAEGDEAKTAHAGRVLVLMRALDEAFYRIHPRALKMPPSLAAPAPSAWLAALSEKRRNTGAYAESGALRLVPRGPLLRSPRSENASSADSMADRFSALGVVPRTLKESERTIHLGHRVLASDMGRGVPPGKMPGAESIAFIPVADDHTDLCLRTRSEDGQYFVAVDLAAHVQAAARIGDALAHAGFADIAIAPELTVPETEIAALSEALFSLVARPRLLVAGSGASITKNPYGMAWNQSSMLNGCGALLWTQRKIWQSELNQQQLKNYGVADAADARHLEDYAACNTLHVLDIDTLGRCAVLICQDIQAQPMAEELIRCFQPDWIFTPILDCGISDGRWAHQRAFELSANSRARFLVASSTTLAAKRMITDPGCGLAAPHCALAVGPKAGDEHNKGREYKLLPAVTPSAASFVSYAIAVWGSGDWKMTVMGAA